MRLKVAFLVEAVLLYIRWQQIQDGAGTIQRLTQGADRWQDND